MLIVDSGASVCISPLRSDFITYKPSQMKIKDLSSSNKVQGEGIIKWRVLDSSGQEISIERVRFSYSWGRSLFVESSSSSLFDWRKLSWYNIRNCSQTRHQHRVGSKILSLQPNSFLACLFHEPVKQVFLDKHVHIYSERSFCVPSSLRCNQNESLSFSTGRHLTLAPPSVARVD